MAVFNNILAGASGQTGGAAAGYEIERSLRFDSSATSFLNRTPEAAGNRKTFTWSGWVKRAKLGTAQSIFTAGTNASTEYDTIEFASNDQIYIYSYSYPNFVYDLRTTQVFRDVSAWYHIVLSVDTTNSTANDRVKLYVNGVRVETFSTNSPPSQNVDSAYWNTANPHYIGYSISRFPADKYLADVHFIDGQALAATDFGEYDANNVWQPKAYVSTSKNDGTTWSSTTTSNVGFFSGEEAIYAFDADETTYAGVATGGASNYIEWTGSVSVSSSLRVKVSTATNSVHINGSGTAAVSGTGWLTVPSPPSTLTALRVYGSSGVGARIYAVEIDGAMLVDGAYSYGRNGFHLPFSDNSSTIALGTDTSVTVSAAEANKGMDVITYTGNGGTQTINGLRFAPDFVWIKDRAANGHGLFDTIRGPKVGLFSNLTNGDTTDNDSLTSFLSSGFTLGTGGTTFSSNINGSNYVAWCWKAGGPAVTNTDGTITSQVSANQDYGFSIVTYSGNSTAGATIGHGLGSAPSFIITKMRTGPTGQGWQVGHASLGWTKRLYLQATNAEMTSSGAWNDTAPTSSVFSAGISDLVNETGYTYVAYCWSEVSGFSKFGSYSGGTNPQTITTGFKPRFLLIKRTDSSASHYVWLMIDSNRGGVKKLAANGSYAENDISYIGDDTQNVVEFLDTGFKLTTTNAASNASGGTYIYAAFASEPGNNWALNNFVANQTSTGFKAVTYAGTSSTQNISGLGFSPDLVWLKNRDAGTSHGLFDSVRGVNNYLKSDDTGAENAAGSKSDLLTTFGTDGFTLGANGSGGVNCNESGYNYVAWCWDAGSSTVTNTAGSINSQVRANTDLGFSIVTFDATSAGGSAVSVGHGLGKRPDMFIVKSRDDSATGWYTWHQGLSNLQENRLFLHGTNTEAGNTSIWNNTAPTDTLLHIGPDPHDSGDNCVAYCFTSKPGVSAFGSYTGNGSTTGPVVTTGFEPAFLIIKNRTGAGGSWVMYDNVRDTGDPKTLRLFANSSTGDSTGANPVSFLANGFQPKDADSYTNANNQTYIYIAFASPPSGEEIDSLLDSPTEANVDSDTGAGGEVSGNYATLNPLVGGATLSNGNLDYTTTANTATSTIGVTSGKYYAEVTAGGSGAWIGITNNPNERLDSVDTNTIALIDGDGDSYDPSSTQTYTSYSGFSAGDVIGIALDATNLTVDFYVNNTKVKTYTTFTVGGPYFFAIDRSGAVTQTFSWNWGQRPFAFAAPTGYQPLTTALLDDPTIADGSTAMDVVTYSGNSGDGLSTTQDITTNFSPDMVWIKSRSDTNHHVVFDTVRGAGKRVFPSRDVAEDTKTQTLTTFNSNGFTLNGDNSVNDVGINYVAWTWDGGSSTVSNTDGSITSSVRANASAGFSIVTYTGTGATATVGHGCGVAPSLILCKSRTASVQWVVYHADLGKNKFLGLNTTDAAGTFTSYWGAGVTSTVFGLQNLAGGNNNGNMVAYCWAPVEGYSAFGSYTGNGSSDGPFVYTGFRPAFVLIKNSSSAANWMLYDTARNPYNTSPYVLSPNTSDGGLTYDAYGGAYPIDILSNGFKPRDSLSNINGSSNTLIYAAFAENPFKTARAR